MEDTKYKVGNVEVPSVWFEPQKHNERIEQIIFDDAKKEGITVDELKKRNRQNFKEIAEDLEYKMLGASGFGPPIFLYESKPNGYFYRNLINKLKSLFNKGKE